MKKILFTLLSAAIAVSAAAGDKNYLRYVDPYIGAGGHGHVFVGACVPFGAIQVGPQNIFKGWDWCSGAQPLTMRCPTTVWASTSRSDEAND